METHSTFTLRPLTLQDAAAASELCLQLGYPSTSEQVHARLQHLLPSKEVLLLCAEEGGVLLGMMETCIEHHLHAEAFAELKVLVVRDTARSQGIGKALCIAAEDWARARGFSVLQLRSRSTRTEAHRFYQRDGYTHNKTSFYFQKLLEP